MKRQEAETMTPGRRAYAYQQAFLAKVSPDDVAAIGEALLKQAKAGDLVAAKLLLDRVLGTTPVAQWPNDTELERNEMLSSF